MVNDPRGDEPFDSCDIIREVYRLRELKLVSDGVRRLEDQSEEKDAKRAREERLAGDRARRRATDNPSGQHIRLHRRRGRGKMAS